MLLQILFVDSKFLVVQRECVTTFLNPWFRYFDQQNYDFHLINSLIMPIYYILYW